MSSTTNSTLWLKGIVGEKGGLVLQDLYVFRIPESKLLAIHSVSSRELNLYIQKLARHLIYEIRLNDFWLKRHRVKFDPGSIERAVWKEYLAAQIDLGRVTSEIATDLGVELEFVNGLVG